MNKDISREIRAEVFSILVGRGKTERINLSLSKKNMEILVKKAKEFSISKSAIMDLLISLSLRDLEIYQTNKKREAKKR